MNRITSVRTGPTHEETAGKGAAYGYLLWYRNLHPEEQSKGQRSRNQVLHHTDDAIDKQDLALRPTTEAVCCGPTREELVPICGHWRAAEAECTETYDKLGAIQGKQAPYGIYEGGGDRDLCKASVEAEDRHFEETSGANIAETVRQANLRECSISDYRTYNAIPM